MLSTFSAAIGPIHWGTVIVDLLRVAEAAVTIIFG